MNNKKRFDKIIQDIKSIRIQGARNIAKAALYAYSLEKTQESKHKLINARPTEPMLVNVLRQFDKIGYNKTSKHFDEAQKRINKNLLKVIKKNSIIFTHCHSTNVVLALIYAKKHGKKFEVYNTETRPLFQGRQTARELEKAGIKVTQFVDSAIDIALEGKGKAKKVNLVLLGADAILKKGVINKVGSGMIAELAHYSHIPVFIVADSWKFSHIHVKIEERKVNEIWNSAPKHVKMMNPAFELVKKKYISGIVSELGVLKFDKFLRRI
jgi:translation initiation factor 2B subunit (eIF-2B alpha/beta/delta family)